MVTAVAVLLPPPSSSNHNNGDNACLVATTSLQILLLLPKLYTIPIIVVVCRMYETDTSISIVTISAT